MSEARVPLDSELWCWIQDNVAAMEPLVGDIYRRQGGWLVKLHGWCSYASSMPDPVDTLRWVRDRMTEDQAAFQTSEVRNGADSKAP